VYIDKVTPLRIKYNHWHKQYRHTNKNEEDLGSVLKVSLIAKILV